MCIFSHMTQISLNPFLLVKKIDKGNLQEVNLYSGRVKKLNGDDGHS